MSRSLLALCAALALVRTTPAHAQLIATLDAGVASVAYDGMLRSSAWTVTPTIRVEQDLLTVTASGTWSRFEMGGWSSQGSVTGSAFTPSLGPLRLELGGTAGGSLHEDRTKTGQWLGQGRLHAVASSAGVWIGAAAGQTWLDSLVRGVTVTEAGAWTRIDAATLFATMSPTRVEELRYTDLEAGIRWTRGRVELLGFGGTRHTSEIVAAESWGGVQATLWLSRHVAVVGGAGAYPIDYTQGYPGGSYATVSLRFATHSPTAETRRSLGRVITPSIARPVAAGFEVRPVGPGRVALRVRAPGAHRVEIMGDFTDWEPRALARAGGDVWEITVAAPAGSHRMNLRVDGGAWGVPPGVTAITDDFNGVVGLVTLP